MEIKERSSSLAARIGCGMALVPVALIALIFTCADRPGEVTAAEFGTAWPLTVPEASVRCSPDGNEYTVVVNGTVYALNGVAKARGKPPVDPIWRPHPEIEGLKVDITPLFERAQRMCPK